MKLYIAILLVQALIATRLMAEPRGDIRRGNEPRGERDSMAFLGELNLSEEQKKQLQALEENGSAGDEDWKEKLKDSKQQLKGALETSDSDEEIWRLFRANQRMRNQIGEDRFRRRLEIRRILTPEQRKESSPRARGSTGRPNPKSGESRRYRKRED